MKKIEEYSTIQELEEAFNNEWFGKWISGSEKNIEDFTDEIIQIILLITDWNEEVIENTSKWNIVYWYCLRLLYLNNSNNDYIYLDDVFEFLDSITPFTK